MTGTSGKATALISSWRPPSYTGALGVSAPGAFLLTGALFWRMITVLAGTWWSRWYLSWRDRHFGGGLFLFIHREHSAVPDAGLFPIPPVSESEHKKEAAPNGTALIFFKIDGPPIMCFAKGGVALKHVGDVTKLSGYELPAVDCISGGSPCQDLSVAGRRAGMKHEDKGDGETTRSGLFMDQMRIVKEMRERDRAVGRSGRFVRPRYMVWENVPGALSSPGKDQKGEDFAAVLEEIIKVAEPGAALRVRVPNGGWPNSGCYYAEDGSWSVAWRVHDAQFWGATQYADDRVLFLGTPQRRRRIALVADFGGLSAAEVLFERKGLSWDSDESGETGERTPARTESGLGDAISFQERAGKPGGGQRNTDPE